MIQAELNRESRLAHSTVPQNYNAHRHDHCVGEERTSQECSGELGTAWGHALVEGVELPLGVLAGEEESGRRSTEKIGRAHV